MKTLFKGFNQPSDAELKHLWDNAIFIFDTNVLTNLYRYQASTRETLLKVMEQLSDRVWIPYHVALEYQRNRLNVIHDQHKKFEDTKNTVKKAVDSLNQSLSNLQLKKRHSHINPDKLIHGISSLTDDFYQELNHLERDSLKIGSEDHLLKRLEELFEGKTGDIPTYDFIKSIDNEGKKRFENSIPPGYKDRDKAKQSDNLFTFGGIEYQRHYGDLIVWKQIISHVNNNAIKHLIFVTDDNKEDWWQITKGKTIGFRPELVDEIYRKTTLDNFHAYNTESFLNRANLHLDNLISKDAIEEVKLVSKDTESSGKSSNDYYQEFNTKDFESNININSETSKQEEDRQIHVKNTREFLRLRLQRKQLEYEEERLRDFELSLQREQEKEREQAIDNMQINGKGSY